MESNGLRTLRTYANCESRASSSQYSSDDLIKVDCTTELRGSHVGLLSDIEPAGLRVSAQYEAKQSNLVGLNREINNRNTQVEIPDMGQHECHSTHSIAINCVDLTACVTIVNFVDLDLLLTVFGKFANDTGGGTRVKSASLLMIITVKNLKR